MSTLDLSTDPRTTNLFALIRRLPGGSIRFWLVLGVSLAVLSAVLLPLNLLTTQRFHHDEALYATWALQIASGENPLLAQISIDKPPLFIYTVATSFWLLGSTETAARLPSILATGLTVGLAFWLGRKLYGNGVGVLAAWLVALSPFTILFAPTAFTDPMLVMLVLVSCLAAAYGRAVWAGILVGLAIATKQQGLFFLPLVVLLFGSRVTYQGSGSEGQGEKTTHDALRLGFSASRNFLVAIVLTLTPVFLWDSARHQSPGFWQLSLINYGGLNTTAASFGERGREFGALLQYATASPVLNTIFVVGLPFLLIYGLWQSLKRADRLEIYSRNGGGAAPTSQAPGVRIQAMTDWIFALFILVFILGHIWFSFQIWDRYLLGLIPFLALLLARILLLPWSILKQYWLDRQPRLIAVACLCIGLGLICLLALTLSRPGQDAVNGRYPLGSNSGALSGIEQIVAYLQGNTDADTTLYHHWLGTHWRFYLWGYPYDLQFWPSPKHLASRAQPGHLIAFPAWHSETEVRLALADVGLELRELTRAYKPIGSPSIVLYQIVEKEPGSRKQGARG